MEPTNQFLADRAMRPSRRIDWQLPYGTTAQSSRVYDLQEQQKVAFGQRLTAGEQTNAAVSPWGSPPRSPAAATPRSPVATPSLGGSPASASSSRFGTPPNSPPLAPVKKLTPLTIERGWPFGPWDLSDEQTPKAYSPLSRRESGEATPTSFTRPPELRDTSSALSHPSQRTADGQGPKYGSQTKQQSPPPGRHCGGPANAFRQGGHAI